MFQEPIATFIFIPMCCCAIGCQQSTLNRLFGSWFGCVFLVWRHHLRIIAVHFQTFFYTIFLFLTFVNIHIYFIILKTYDQQFTLTTKNHCISSLSKKISASFGLIGKPQLKNFCLANRSLTGHGQCVLCSWRRIWVTRTARKAYNISSAPSSTTTSRITWSNPLNRCGYLTTFSTCVAIRQYCATTISVGLSQLWALSRTY